MWRRLLIYTPAIATSCKTPTAVSLLSSAPLDLFHTPVSAMFTQSYTTSALQVQVLWYASCSIVCGHHPRLSPAPCRRCIHHSWTQSPSRPCSTDSPRCTTYEFPRLDFFGVVARTFLAMNQTEGRPAGDYKLVQISHLLWCPRILLSLSSIHLSLSRYIHSRCYLICVRMGVHVYEYEYQSCLLAKHIFYLI